MIRRSQIVRIMPPEADCRRFALHARQPVSGARLAVNRSLCGEDSEKDTRHFEIDLTGWGLNYEVGDSMTVWPTNDPALVG